MSANAAGRAGRWLGAVAMVWACSCSSGGGGGSSGTTSAGSGSGSGGVVTTGGATTGGAGACSDNQDGNDNGNNAFALPLEPTDNDLVNLHSSNADRLFRAVPRSAAYCIPSLCPDDGTSNEHDWVTALWHFRTDSGTQPTFNELFGMLEAVHTDGCAGLNQATCGSTSGCTWDSGDCLGWPPSGADDDYWTQFDTAMSSHLSGSLQSRWDALAQTWELDD